MNTSEDKYSKSTRIKISRSPRPTRATLSSSKLVLDDEKLLTARTNAPIFPSPSSLAKRNLEIKISESPPRNADLPPLSTPKRMNGLRSPSGQLQEGLIRESSRKNLTDKIRNASSAIMFNPNSFNAASVISTTNSANANKKRTDHLTVKFGIFGNIPDLELLHEFRLKENEFAQQPPSAISPFRFLPFSEELAPLSDRKTRDLNKMDAIVQREVTQADIEKWINEMRLKVKKKKLKQKISISRDSTTNLYKEKSNRVN